MTALERAYELARSGQCKSVSVIMRRLSSQDRDVVEDQLRVANARRKLILLCSEAWLTAH
jgi:hypothetical protein